MSAAIRALALDRVQAVWPTGRAEVVYDLAVDGHPEFVAGGVIVHNCDWWEEMAANPQLAAAWDQAEFGLRLGTRPHSIASTTPRNRKKLRELLGAKSTVVTHGTIDDNPHLDPDFKDTLKTKYAGTRLGRQELGGELLEDVEGALWQSRWIEETRRPAPALDRLVIGVDPAVTSGENSAECGIVAGGFSVFEQRGYVLGDFSLRATPDKWGRKSIDVYGLLGADHITAEVNNGGDLVKFLLRTIDSSVPVNIVHASRGKITRAEPVAMLYEQGRVSHIGVFPELEEQMTTYTGDPSEESPDRLDALVWALWDLMVRAGRAGVVNTQGLAGPPVVQVGDMRLTGRHYIDRDPRR